jgi:hypothetical protein
VTVPVLPGPAACSAAGTRPALAIAHPGHELRVHGWLEVARPLVFVLTDGSGRSGRSRLAASAQVLAAAGARPASLFGDFPDAVVYRALRGGDLAFFVGLARRLADAFVRHGIDVVAADAAEGYNSVHDVWRLLVDAAVALVDRPLCNLAFPLVGKTPPLRDPQARPGCLHLDDAALARKLAAARGYSALADEVREQLRRLGSEAFRTETLWPAEALAPVEPSDGLLFYEVRGEQQVRAGRYPTAIRYRDHVRPVAEALAQLTGKKAA